ncbi:hypothetical protein [Aeoliella mucimassa]|uniref:Uncharacterized protein n=1 Tax=Aeoliella mucimassa TaxID=2527972 RepID=A0A518AH50_9BACT|nr:hypothetical protein [Aeoliella mucimassa]QDU54053.1 hypothetical protein Pan181_02330 [Aeoliella mucimassa]
MSPLYPIVALTDMRPNIGLAFGVLLLGMLWLVALAKRDQHRNALPKRNWLPWIALVAGPLVGAGWMLADAYLFYPEYYVIPSDITTALTAHLIVGGVVGCLAATTLALANWLSTRNHQPSDQQEEEG